MKSEVYSERAYQAIRTWNAFIVDSYDQVLSLKKPEIKRQRKYYLVYIDYRKHPYTEYVLRNALHFLGRDWGLILFVWNRNRSYLEKMVGDWGEVQIYNIDTEHHTDEMVANLRSHLSFWEEQPGSYFLYLDLYTLFRRSGIDTYLKYDYLEPQAIADATQRNFLPLGNPVSLRSKSFISKGASLQQKSKGSSFGENSLEKQILDCYPELQSPTELYEEFAQEASYQNDPLLLHRSWAHLEAAELHQLLYSIDYSEN